MGPKIFYLASPYHHERVAVRRRRYRETVRAAAGLMARGTRVFSPITHNHALVETGLINAGADYAARWRFWRLYDFAMLGRCDGLLVLTIPGWQQSQGVNAELREARRLGQPVGYIDPATLKISWERKRAQAATAE
jgi:hypothetical protein